MVSNIDRVYATEYSRKKKEERKILISRNRSIIYRFLSETRMGREISIVSSDKTLACGEAAPDFERYERCNWSRSAADNSTRTRNRVYYFFRSKMAAAIAILACERGLRRLFLNYYKWDRIFSFRLLPRFDENWLRFKGICCYIVLIYIYDSI